MTLASRRVSRVFLHVGAAKTGTTYIQDVLWNNRATLRQAGVLYPGLSSDAHFHAAMDFQGSHFQEHFHHAVPGAWDRLLGEARNWPGTVVLSHELFSMVDENAARAALNALSWAEVHIVLTARDLARQIPAVWQEDVKNRQVLTFDQFARQLSAPNGAAHYLAELFWRLQDVPQVLSRWAGQLPKERVHLVTVPPQGAPADELWSRFSRATGIDPASCALDLAVKANRSMGVVETNLLRRLNLELGDQLDWPSYDVLVKDYLALSVIGGRDTTVPLALPAAEQDWVAEKSRQMVAALRDSGYDVIGDLADLIGAPVPTPARHPDDASDTELADTAVHALAGLLLWARDHTPPRQSGWRRKAIALTQRNMALRQLHRQYLATKSRRGGSWRGRGGSR
jgi:hypothetical protein